MHKTVYMTQRSKPSRLWSCMDSLCGAACTKVVWTSFAQILISIYKKHILLESSCDALSEKRANPVQPLGHYIAELRSFKYLAIGKTRLHTGFYLVTERCCPYRSVPAILQQSTGYCSFITNYAYLLSELIACWNATWNVIKCSKRPVTAHVNECVSNLI